MKSYAIYQMALLSDP